MMELVNANDFSRTIEANGGGRVPTKTGTMICNLAKLGGDMVSSSIGSKSAPWPSFDFRSQLRRKMRKTKRP
jgi:hypothetical protein